MTKWEGKKITIFGLGKSGAAIASKLVPLKASITLTDTSKEEKLNPQLVQEMKNLGVKLELGGHTNDSVLNTELIIMSPGVHLDLPVLTEARKKGIPIISEIEAAFRFLVKPIIAITGTNGKTTTATLVYEFLKAGGKKVALAGNIGNPLITVNDEDLDFIVVELSSYQLESIVAFRPWISLILNISEDHLERHKNMDEYIKTKGKIFENQKRTDYLIYNAEDKLVSKLVEGADAKLVPFSKDTCFIDPRGMLIPGKHNLENALAAAQAALLAGVSSETIKKVLSEFKGVEHRIEFVREKSGVKYYNDSKGTNPNSTIIALKALNRGTGNVILIAGGKDKGGDLTELASQINKTTKAVFLIGESASRFQAAFKNINAVACTSLEEAVKKAADLSREKDIVLLSPACASFDMFASYEDRGRRFKELVAAL